MSIRQTSLPVASQGGRQDNGPQRHLHPNPQDLGRLPSLAKGLWVNSLRWGDYSGLSASWPDAITRVLMMGISGELERKGDKMWWQK